MKKEKIVFAGKTEQESTELIETFEALVRAPEMFKPEGINLMVIMESKDGSPTIIENGMEIKEIFGITYYLALHYPDIFTYCIEKVAEMHEQKKIYRTIH